MLGGMFAGHDESGGELIENGDGRMYKSFYGMSSAKAMESHYGEVAKHRAPEGKEVRVPYRGALETTVQSVLGGLRSACSYVGARRIKDLSEVRQNSSGSARPPTKSTSASTSRNRVSSKRDIQRSSGIAMEGLLLAVVGAFIAAALTVPAGFGLSTILTPLVLLVMGPHEAVAVVAVVHGAHNAGKFAALRESVDFVAFRRYGIWLVMGAILGAILQNEVPQRPLLALIGAFLVTLPVLSLSEKWTGYSIPEANDRLGGFGSGLMGGLTGHQGALRAMFLTRRLPDKMEYAATASVLALCVDLSRIPVYLLFRYDEIATHLGLTLALVVAALAGVRVGKRWLESLKSEWIHNGVMAGIVASGLFYLQEALG
ncbi:MAG: hypothetical protein Ct9H300mP10_03160 [Methanobacteriota archaeon]|nr:MAG: hypothetical protein Ct9H300mP10_03160 [Euryarchaeota archaeon]